MNVHVNTVTAFNVWSEMYFLFFLFYTVNFCFKEQNPHIKKQKYSAESSFLSLLGSRTDQFINFLNLSSSTRTVRIKHDEI